jgi:hypothetical protein
MLRVFWRDCGERELPAHDSARIEVVLPSTLAQFIERHATFGVARKHERLACVDERLESDDV